MIIQLYFFNINSSKALHAFLPFYQRSIVPTMRDYLAEMPRLAFPLNNDLQKGLQYHNPLKSAAGLNLCSWHSNWSAKTMLPNTENYSGKLKIG
jgi:hypothetical protein